MNRLSAAGAAFLRLQEGFEPNWYRDSTGTPTIGIGFTWASDSFRQWWLTNRPGQPFAAGAKMSAGEADAVLMRLCNDEYGAAVDKFLGKMVPQSVFDAMTSAVFNLGVSSLKWKWAAAAKAGDYPGAAALLRKTGTTSKGKFLQGLADRRAREALLLEKGIYTGVKTPPPQKPVERVAPPAGPVAVPPQLPQPSPTPAGGLARLLALLLTFFTRKAKP